MNLYCHLEFLLVFYSQNAWLKIYTVGLSDGLLVFHSCFDMPGILFSFSHVL